MSETLLSDFINHLNKKEAVIAQQVYLDLCEVKKYFDVSYSYNASLNKFIITAKKDKNGALLLFLPITANDEINFSKLQKIFQVTLQQTICLVIVHADSTCVYYQATNSLLQPADTKVKHLKEKKQEKLDNALKKNRNMIEQAALFGLKVTIPVDKRNEDME